MKTNSKIRFSAARRGLSVFLLLLAFLGVGSFLAPHAAAAGATCAVNPSHTGPYPTIQSAVNDSSCATIRLTRGTYTENVTIYRDVAIVGLGPSLTTVNGGGSGTVFTVFRGNVTLSGLTITNGSGFYGGGVSNVGGTVLIQKSTITGNTAYVGGGISNDAYLDGNSLTVQNSTISGNTASQVGGGIYSGSDTILVVQGSTISGNTAENNGGGGIFTYGTTTVRDSTISSNSAQYFGGGIATALGTLTLINTTLINNTPDNCSGTGCPA